MIHAPRLRLHQDRAAPGDGGQDSLAQAGRSTARAVSLRAAWTAASTAAQQACQERKRANQQAKKD